MHTASISLLALVVDGGEDDGVGDNDDDQGDQVHHDHAEDGVGRLVARWGEAVECDALGVPRERGVGFHVKNVHLEEKGRRIQSSTVGLTKIKLS